MKKLLLASIGILAMSVAAASAADLPQQRMMPAKAPLYEPQFSWTGFYIGINGGGGFGRSDFSAPFPTGSFNTSGGLVGGTLGYNYQTGNIVLGSDAKFQTDLVRAGLNYKF
jgi:outer membrane immunogenic protein